MSNTLPESGKRLGQLLSVTSVAGHSPSCLLFLTDHNSSCRFLIDTGAEVSIIPPSAADQKHKQNCLALRSQWFHHRNFRDTLTYTGPWPTVYIPMDIHHRGHSHADHQSRLLTRTWTAGEYEAWPPCGYSHYAANTRYHLTHSVTQPLSPSTAQWHRV